MAIPRSKSTRETNLKKVPKKEGSRSPGRQDCDNPRSMDLPHAENEPPGSRGACEKESEVQGSE